MSSSAPGSYDELSGDRWRLAAGEVVIPPELGDEIGATDLVATHGPLADLVSRLADAHRVQRDLVAGFFGHAPTPAPYLVGVTGGIAAGKSVSAQTLAVLLAARDGVTVEVVTTDGFLMSNQRLEGRGLAARKGFPESYDHAALLAFVVALKSGADEVHAPVYDHAVYDIVADRTQPVGRCDVVILEGLNVLQLTDRAELQVSDYLDFSIYVDADEDDLKAWFHARLAGLRAEAQAAPGDASFYAAFAAMSPDEFTAMAEGVWMTVNHPNLVDHIAPTRSRADLILEKQSDHTGPPCPAPPPLRTHISLHMNQMVGPSVPSWVSPVTLKPKRS